MAIEFDAARRDATWEARGLDMAEAATVFDGLHLTFEDARQDCGEPRFITVGHLADRMVVIVWTPRDAACRIISLRKANDREQRLYQPRL